MWKDVSVPEAYPSHKFRLLLSTVVIQDVALRNLSPQRLVSDCIYCTYSTFHARFILLYGYKM